MMLIDSIRFQSWFNLGFSQGLFMPIVTANTPCIDNASSKLPDLRYFRTFAIEVVATIQHIEPE
jgi:hypothetical protein